MGMSRERTTLESSRAARLCREKGDQVSVSTERGAGRILEAEFMKNRDLAQLGSDVFMNGMGGIPSLCFWRSSTLSLSPRDTALGGGGKARCLWCGWGMVGQT